MGFMLDIDIAQEPVAMPRKITRDERRFQQLRHEFSTLARYFPLFFRFPSLSSFFPLFLPPFPLFLYIQPIFFRPYLMALFLLTIKVD